MASRDGEDPVRRQRARHRALLLLVVGTALLIGGSATIVLVPWQPVQRVVLGGMAVAALIALLVVGLRANRRSRREGVDPPTREEAAQLPALVTGTTVSGLGLALVSFQALEPAPDLGSALVVAAPFALIWLSGLWPTWQLRRQLRRDGQAEQYAE